MSMRYHFIKTIKKTFENILTTTCSKTGGHDYYTVDFGPVCAYCGYKPGYEEMNTMIGAVDEKPDTVNANKVLHSINDMYKATYGDGLGGKDE